MVCYVKPRLARDCDYEFPRDNNFSWQMFDLRVCMGRFTSNRVRGKHNKKLRALLKFQWLSGYVEDDEFFVPKDLVASFRTSGPKLRRHSIFGPSSFLSE